MEPAFGHERDEPDKLACFGEGEPFAFLKDMNFISFFRNCKHCGLYTLGTDLFCEDCWFLLEKTKNTSDIKIFKSSEIIVRPLFLWREKESIISDLVMALKGGTPYNVLKDLSIELSQKYFAREEAIFVPVPSSKVGEKDHAYIMAKIIAEHLQQEFWDGLEWKYKSKNQKFLKKTERFIAEMTRVKEISKKKKIVLIDDVVTTGATAMAARKAIQGLNQIEVWSLACRL